MPLARRSSMSPLASTSVGPSRRYRSRWKNGSLPEYSAMRMNVGLFTTSRTPTPRAMPLASSVLPTPSPPYNAITSPGRARAPSATPKARVWSAELVTMVRVAFVRAITPRSVQERPTGRTRSPEALQVRQGHEPAAAASDEGNGEDVDALVEALHGRRPVDRASRAGARAPDDADRARRNGRKRGRRLEDQEGGVREDRDARAGRGQQQLPGWAREGASAEALEHEDGEGG